MHAIAYVNTHVLLFFHTAGEDNDGVPGSPHMHTRTRSQSRTYQTNTQICSDHSLKQVTMTMVCLAHLPTHCNVHTHTNTHDLFVVVI